MRYWLGLGCAAVGVWLLASALARRKRVMALRKTGVAVAATRESPLAILGDVMPALVTVFLAYTAIKSTFAFFVLDGMRVLSLLDLAGFLFLLAAYGTWVVTRTKFRDPEVETARPPSPLTASNDNQSDVETNSGAKPRLVSARETR